jgi:hypothetical protein
MRLAAHLPRAALGAAAAWLTTACADVTPTGPQPGAARPLAKKASTPPAVAEDNVVLQWSGELMEAIRVLRPAPPVVARALAVMHTAMYDAWAAYDPIAVGTRLHNTLRRPAAERTEANKRHAVSQAAYRALVDLFPARAAVFAARLTALGYNPADATTNPASPAGVGNAAAAAVLAWRHDDGSNQLGTLTPGAYADYTGYVPVNTVDLLTDPAKWQPLRVPNGSGGFNVQRWALPQWGRITPFALPSGSTLRPKRVKNAYPSNGFRKEAEDLVEISAGLTDTHKAIAEYWSDGPASETPPGHWCVIAAWVSKRDRNTLDEDVKLFFALGNAMLDASIASWDAKRAFDTVRPITAIRFLQAGKNIRAWGGPGRGTVTMRGEEWMPYQVATFVTPPFAEFPSGHSTFSAAAATVLAAFTRSDRLGMSVTIPAGSSLIEPGVVPARPVTLSWPTFSAAADQAGLSRRYGGIHFEEGDETGRLMGRGVGALTVAKAATYFFGIARPASAALAAGH